MFFPLFQPPLTRLALVLALLITLCQAVAYNSTALVLASDAQGTDEATYLLNGYGIGHEAYVVSENGITLPPLEDANGGNYGLLVIVAQAQTNGTSSLTTAQWNSLYAYQKKYGVRMVQLDVVPSADFGVSFNKACCDSSAGIEQNITLIESAQTSHFPTAGLR